MNRSKLQPGKSQGRLNQYKARIRRSFIGLICLAVVVIAGAVGSGKLSRAAAQTGPPSIDGVWQEVAESSIPVRGQRQVMPRVYRTLRLDQGALRGLLAKAPMEFTNEAKAAPVTISLPMPDRTYSRFKVVESPMMEPALAAKYPEFKTYSGVGIDDPSAIMRCGLTLNGFHAIILAPSGSVYIDPYAKGDTEHYISYYKRDYPNTGEPFHCGVSDDASTSRPRPSRIEPKFVSYGFVRFYRLAMSATSGYTNFFGLPGDTEVQKRDRAFAAITTTVNRVNSIYGRDLGVRLVLIANELSIIYVTTNDPYTGAPGTQTILDENQAILDDVIGGNNYDIGHVVGLGGSGLAQRPSVCLADKAKGSTGTAAPAGDPFDVDYVAHEMGHQLNAQHTFNDGSTGSCGGNNRAAGSAYEPGSGSTIMGYAGICPSGGGGANLQLNSDDYFHAKSVEDIRYYVHDPGGDGSTCGNPVPTGNLGVNPSISLNYTIPNSTPFRLYAGDFNDPDSGDAIFYTWEEYDLGIPSPPEGDGGDRPLFRSYKFSRNSDRIFPSLQYILNNANSPPATYNCAPAGSPPVNCLTGETLPVNTRTMFFRLTLRDNRDAVAILDNVTINIRSDAGPFFVFGQTSWSQGTTQTVTWGVGNTNGSPINCANVKISLSADGGTSFPYVLAESTPNDGSETITVPQLNTTQARLKVEAVGNIFFDISDANFTITNPTVTTADDGTGDNLNPVPGSLRQALLVAQSLDASAGPIPILFNLPGGASLKTINVAKPLPTLDTRVFIDGWSQGGAGYTGPPLIELNGQSVVPPTPGVKVSGLSIPAAGSGSRIRGLIINRFTGPGIVMTASNTIIEGCYIGTDAAGAARAPNEEDGIRIVNGSGNKIGMPGAGHGNLISGNGVAFGTGDGVEINGSTASGNIVQNNIIGLNAAGTAIVNNVASGVHIIGAPNTVVGGPGVETRNILSGAAVGTGSINGHGVHIEGTTATGTLITGNYIGTNAAGTADLGNNGSGIFINNAPNTTIGGLTIIETGLNERNVISGNNNNGQIYITGVNATGTKIKGNYVGLNATGDARIETNGIIGILIESSGNQIGGTTVGDGNVISGNGIGINFAAGASSNVVQGNRIGTDKTGTVDLGNETGIQIFLGQNNVVGGTSPEARNLISGNNSAGINITGSSPNFAAGNLIQGNYIGTNAAGTAALGNLSSGGGIILGGVKDVTIGGTAPGAGNLISGNGNGNASDGVLINNANTGIVVQGNLIGTNAAGTAALGNLGNGIFVNGFTGGVTIGGAASGARNVIAASGQSGLRLGGGNNIVKGNFIGTDVTGTANWHSTISGMEIVSSNNVIGGTSPGEGNVIAFNGANSNFSGIQVSDGGATGNTIRGNSIFSNTGLGIDIGGIGLTANDNCDADIGGNNQQNFPVLTSAGNQGGTTLIAGSLNSSASASFILDFYANPACDASGNGEGKILIGSLPVTTDGSCNTSFAVTLPVAVAVGQTITATATNAGGSTSEFSACRTVTAGLTLPAGSYTNIVVNSGTTLTLAGDVTITGNLTLNGDLNTNGFTLTMPAAATSSGTGDVIGNLRRTGITLGTPLTFGNPFNFIRFDSGTPPTEVTVNLVKSAPAGFPNAVQRTYTITPVGGSNYAATLQLHYLDTELNGNDEATLQLWRNDGTAWAGQGATSRDAADNWIQLTGVSQFSPWTVGGPSGPTAIELVEFVATTYDDATLLEWQTGFEADNLGFNVYREAGGKRVPINDQLVAGSALRAGSRLGAGERYAWWDGVASPTTAYWLEDINLKGESAWHGPFFAKASGSPPPSRSNAATLIRLGNPNNEVGSTRIVGVVGQTLHSSNSNLNAAANPLAAGPAVKISVKQEGFYRLTRAELMAAGLAPAVDPRMLQLFVDGREIPINVSTDQEGWLQAVEFYGYGLDTPSTDARTYWLVEGQRAGKRIPIVEAEGVSSSSQSFTRSVERRDRTIYIAALRNGERENFFGAVVTSAGVSQNLTLQHLAPSDEPATLEITLQGVTRAAHRVAVLLNGLVAGFINFNEQQQGTATFTLPPALLQEGANTVSLTAQNGPGDVSLVDSIRVRYQHAFAADDDLLYLPINGGEQVVLAGFSSKTIRVFDVTDESDTKELAGKISEAKGGYSVTVTAPATGRRQLLALTTGQTSRAASVKRNDASSLRLTTNAADYLMVSSRQFFEALEPLRAARQAEGYQVALVDVEDIYDEFSFGRKAPESLKDFFAYARANWRVKPRLVLLAGDASYDARNYLGLGENDVVPTKLLDTAYLETASDDWLVDFNNDGLPELATGRLPVRTLEEAAAVVHKLLGYSANLPPLSALLVSDANDGFNFEEASAQLRLLLPGGWHAEELRRGQLDAATAKARLFEAINSGERIVNYAGHGSLNLWRGDLLSAGEALKLGNRHLPLFVIMNCLNGYYQDAMMDSLGEALLKAEQGGAVAVWVSSGMTLPQEQATLNQEFYKQLFNPRPLSLGEASIEAKKAVRDADVRRTWNLLGDPAMKLK